MDPSSITAAYTAVKIIKESISGLLEAKVEAKAREKLNEVVKELGAVQDTLFYLREELGRLQTENADLKGKLEDKETWEARQRRYELEQTDGGAVVYSFKGSPKHYACPGCIEKKEIQILQDERVVSGIFKCPGCGKDFPVRPRRRASFS